MSRTIARDTTMPLLRKRIRPRITAALLACAVACGPALAAGDAFVCMEEKQETCDQKNQNLALYIKAHDAFDRGREAGDLSEARSLALKLIANDDARHGKTLLKYIYMQVGMGTHKNYVEAYRWINADLASGTKYSRLDLERTRDRLAKLMTPEQIAEANK